MALMNVYKWLNHEKSRYYTLTVKKEFQDEITIYHKWGGCNSNRGGNKNLSVKTEEEMQKLIIKMMQRRKSRGYELIAPANNLLSSASSA